MPHTTTDSPILPAGVYAAALCRSIGSDGLDGYYDAQTLEIAERHFGAGLSLCDLIVLSARANTGEEVSAKAAFGSTLQNAFMPRLATGYRPVMDLPVILTLAVDFIAQQDIQTVPKSWEDFHIEQVDDGHTVRLGRNITYPASEIENENTSLFLLQGNMIAHAYRRTMDKLFWTDFLNHRADMITGTAGMHSLLAQGHLFKMIHDRWPGFINVHNARALIITPNARRREAENLIETHQLREHVDVFSTAYLDKFGDTHTWYLMPEPKVFPVFSLQSSFAMAQPKIKCLLSPPVPRDGNTAPEIELKTTIYLFVPENPIVGIRPAMKMDDAENSDAGTRRRGDAES